VNHQLYEVFYKLEAGYNFNDSITDIIILQAETIKTLQKQCIDNAIMKTSQSVFVNK
jgi:mannose-1-phosphate guanylyltransferase